MQVEKKGLNYKVDIVVNGTNTRALLDSGTQVRQRHLKLDAAGGESLDAKGVTPLQVTIAVTK